jgi:single-strand DNA-binding protein
MQMNRIQLAGYLAAKPEVRYLPSGTPVANARLGQTYEYVQNDKPVKHTNWFGLAFYGELAGVAQSYEKGDNIDVVGTVQQRQFTPKDGSQRTVYEIVVQHAHVIAKNRHPAAGQDAGAQASVASAASEDKEEVDAWAIL